MDKVMIVDDEKDICMMMTKVVQRKGFEVVTCGDGLTAVEMYKTHKPKITFLDLNIPELKGKQVFDEIRKIDAGARVYFVTGSENEIDKLKQENTPVNGYLM